MSRISSVTADPGPVAAVLRAPGEATLAALDRQTRQPDETVVHYGSWHAACVAALSRGAEWYWLLDGDAVPEPEALQQLFEALAALDGLPSPALLASRVLDGEGRLDPRSEPWPPLLDRVLVIAAAQRRLVSLRLARWGSLLVHRSTLDRYGSPRSDYAGGADDLEWTARILRAEPGYLAPRSVAVRPGVRPRNALAYREVRNRVRMVRGEGWVAQEPVWFGFLLAVDAVRALRATPRPRVAASLVAGTFAGLAARP
jgi:hypothetical protein